jgi:hypothetical protein
VGTLPEPATDRARVSQLILADLEVVTTTERTKSGDPSGYVVVEEAVRVAKRAARDRAALSGGRRDPSHKVYGARGEVPCWS